MITFKSDWKEPPEKMQRTTKTIISTLYLGMLTVGSSKDHCLRFNTPHCGWLQVAKNTYLAVLPNKLSLWRKWCIGWYFKIERAHSNIMKVMNNQGNTCISSSGINLTRPLTTVRVDPSPTSISSTYRESASGCFWTFVIRPTRISSLLIEISASAAALGLASADFVGRCFFPFPSVTNNGIPYISNNLKSHQSLSPHCMNFIPKKKKNKKASNASTCYKSSCIKYILIVH